MGGSIGMPRQQMQMDQPMPNMQDMRQQRQQGGIAPQPGAQGMQNTMLGQGTAPPPGAGVDQLARMGGGMLGGGGRMQVQPQFQGNPNVGRFLRSRFGTPYQSGYQAPQGPTPDQWAQSQAGTQSLQNFLQSMTPSAQIPGATNWAAVQPKPQQPLMGGYMQPDWMSQGGG